MGETFVVVFRESLEAAFLVGAVLGTLRALSARTEVRVVFAAVITGIVASFLGAFSWEYFFGEFEGYSEAIFEGCLMIFAAGLIAHLLLWMKKRGKKIHEHLIQKTKEAVVSGEAKVLFALVFFAVLREGMEMVIFLKAIESQVVLSQLGGFLGVTLAVLFSFALFSGIKHFSPQKVFLILGAILLVVATGLVSEGISKFQEANILPTFFLLSHGTGEEGPLSLLAAVSSGLFFIFFGKWYFFSRKTRNGE